MVSQRSSLLLIASLLAVMFLQIGCATSSPEIVAWEKELSAVLPSKVPKPKQWNDHFGDLHWATYDGTDTGEEAYGPKILRHGVRDYNLNVVWVAKKTRLNYWVGCGIDRPICFIFIPNSKGVPTSAEVYGPTLKSIRATTEGESRVTENGGDILYVTSKGVFRASQIKGLATEEVAP